MNRTTAHFIDNLIELTVGSGRLVLSPRQYQFKERGLSDGFIGNPMELFNVPKSPPEIKFAEVHKWLDGRTHAHYHFPSLFTSPHPQNNTVHGMADLQTKVASPAALILLHGYQMHSFEPLKWFAEETARAGVDVYYMALPYHMRRRPRGTWSGMYAMSADVERTVQSFRQGVLDLRSLITYLKTVKGQKVAIAGLSLGAFTCCMAATVDQRPEALVSILGGASLADIIWAGFSFRLIRNELRRSGVSQVDLEDWWRLMAPGTWKPRIPRERILLIAGEHDPIITPGNAIRLHQAWDRPQIYWYPCGHASVAFYAHQIGDRIASFLKPVLLG
jgi:pimeloyl-ACP methyl ester carboxylesterase